MVQTKDKAYIGIFTAFMLVIAWLAYVGANTQVTAFFPDLVIHIAVLLFLYFNRNLLRLNPTIYSLVAFGMLLHDFGILGFYATSPVPIQWDHLTHFFGGLPIALLLFNFLRPWMSPKLPTRTVTLIALVFFAALGVGALVEVNEFWGFLKLGFGNGAFQFGPGDSFPGIGSDINAISLIGGGWINEGWDLTYDIIGILAGIAVALGTGFVNKKSKLRKFK